MTKKDMEQMEVGDIVTLHGVDSLELQRIRNRANVLPGKYKVKAKSDYVTVERVSDDTIGLTDVLRNMQPGEVIYKGTSRDLPKIAGTAAHVDNKSFKVSLTVKIERI